MSRQGELIEWFSGHQRAILGEMSYEGLQELVRECRRGSDAESQQVGELKAEIERKDKLITELCDALAYFHPQSLEFNELIQRAREATR